MVDVKYILIGLALLIVALAMWSTTPFFPNCFSTKHVYVLVNDSTGAMYQNSQISFEKRFYGPNWVDCDSEANKLQCKEIGVGMHDAMFPIWIKTDEKGSVGHSGIMNENTAINWCEEMS
jgi:hypothetical protein